MKRILGLALLLLLLVLAGCTRPDESLPILRRDGYQNIELQGYTFLGCGSGNTFHTKFSATKNGQPMRGVVCGGWLKGFTVRTFD